MKLDTGSIAGQAGDAIGQAAGGLLAGLGADAMPPGQATRLLKLHTPLGAGVLVPERVDGSEVMIPRAVAGEAGEAGDHEAAGFRLRVQAVSARAGLDLAALLGQPVRVDLLLAGGAQRPFHGHATQVRLLGSDGGLARYELVVEPWLAFLAQRRDSYVFQDRTVMDIAGEVFGDYQGQGTLSPQWRFELADAAAHPRRSLAIQHQETDLAFVLRLLAEEGLFAWFEHAASDDAGLGSHTLVIADHNGALNPFDGGPAASAAEAGQAASGRVRYTQAGPTLAEDGVQRLALRRAVAASRVALASWDHRSLDQRPAAALAAPAAALQAELLQADQPGAYAYEDTTQGRRLAQRRLEAITAWASRGEASGTVRRFAPGSWFELAGHPLSTAGQPLRLAIVAVHHEMRSNVGADRAAGPGFVYRNRAEVLPLSQPVRALAGPQAWAQRPNAPGVQTAIVVGLGAPLRTDRDHRIKVQFHWQRGGRSSHRLEHAGGANAPAGDASGTWVRVAESVAGPNWGASFTPRLGQEVLVDFIEGDIDRPVVIGSLYNGRGRADAQANDAGQGAATSTGNAAAWFPGGKRDGELEGHAHAAAMSGVQTQALASSASGGAGHNRLVLDDTPGQGRLTLASSTEGGGTRATHLSIGHLIHQRRNQRLQPRGHGLELYTPHWGALRAGSAMQLGTHARSGGTTTAAGHAQDSREAQARIAESAELQAALSRSAQAQGAKTPQEAGPLPATEALRAMQRGLAGQAGSDAAPPGAAAEAHAAGGGHGSTPAPERPDLLLASPAGILATTPAHTIASAGFTASLTSAQDINLNAQRHSAAAAKAGIVFYSVGEAGDAAKPNTETGIAWHSATGHNSVQAQSAAMQLDAQATVAIDSSTGSVRIAAPQRVMLNGAGSYLRLEGGDIELGTSGGSAFRAAMKELAGPSRTDAASLKFPPAVLNLPQRFSQRVNLAGLIGMDPGTGGLHEQLPYEAYDASGRLVARGRLDHKGNTQHIYTGEPTKIRLVIGDGQWLKVADTDHGEA